MAFESRIIQLVIRIPLPVFDRRCLFLAGWLPMVCRLQRKFQITAMILGVKGQGQKYLKSVLHLKTQIPRLFFEVGCIYILHRFQINN